MAITYATVRDVSAELYQRTQWGIPSDTRDALTRAGRTETDPLARRTLQLMQESAAAAAELHQYICSDHGIPTFLVKIGTNLTLAGDLVAAVSDGFDHVVDTIQPPMLPQITNPFTRERSYKGKDVPILSVELVDGADYVELTCSPKALGSGRWADLKVFSYPSIETIEDYILRVVIDAGSQACPPVMVGVGIGGTFDHAAKMAKRSVLRPVGEHHPEPHVRDMEVRLLDAINRLGFGPMGTGGDTTAMAVNIEYSCGHGFVPVAVCFNCWINRRASARIHDDGRVEWLD